MVLFAVFIVAITSIVVTKCYLHLTNGKCTSDARLDGKTVIITGANTGIGKVTARELAARGAKVILACRNLEAANRAKEEIVALTGNENVFIRKLDLASLESVREFARMIHRTEQRLDVLVNNAGAAILGDHVTDDGLQIGMQVNHFGPFLLTNLLLDLLKASAPSRIITVSSLLHHQAKLDVTNLNKRMMDVLVYSNSKLCNLLMSSELSRRLEGTGVTSNCLHPGAVRTDLFQHMPQPIKFIWDCYALLFFKNLEEGAQTTIHLAVADEVKNTTGEYFADCIEAKISEAGRDVALAKKVWELSEAAVKLTPNGNEL